MPNPKHRFSQTRTRKRRTHDKAIAPVVMICPNCSSAVEYHHICNECGYYKGKPAIEKVAKA